MGQASGGGTGLCRRVLEQQVVLGINQRALWEVRTTSDRTWMVMLAKFLLAQYTPGLAAMLHDGEHCAFYHDDESSSRVLSIS